MQGCLFAEAPDAGEGDCGAEFDAEVFDAALTRARDVRAFLAYDRRAAQAAINAADREVERANAAYCAAKWGTPEIIAAQAALDAAYKASGEAEAALNALYAAQVETQVDVRGVVWSPEVAGIILAACEPYAAPEAPSGDGLTPDSVRVWGAACREWRAARDGAACVAYGPEGKEWLRACVDAEEGALCAPLDGWAAGCGRVYMVRYGAEATAEVNGFWRAEGDAATVEALLAAGALRLTTRGARVVERDGDSFDPQVEQWSHRDADDAGECDCGAEAPGECNCGAEWTRVSRHHAHRLFWDLDGTPQLMEHRYTEINHYAWDTEWGEWRWVDAEDDYEGDATGYEGDAETTRALLEIQRWAKVPFWGFFDLVE